MNGVRVYTYRMPITSTNTFSLSTVQQLIIDCSAIRSDTSVDQQLSDLISWISTVPQRSHVHVTLRFATGSATGRKIRSRFQSMGCRVSMQTDFSAI
jgi:hypothetical protein